MRAWTWIKRGLLYSLTEMRANRWIAMFLAIWVASVTWAACNSNPTCDKCAKSSEFSWNPANEYVTPRLQRFYALGDELTAAYGSGNFANAQTLAKENLELAASYQCNWNYGNAIHDTNRILGLIALKQGDLDSAANYLRTAGKTPGSPQLDSFGPELDLANELLKAGRRADVGLYLKDIKSFWKDDDGRVDEWLKAIDKGGTPDIDRFSALPLTFVQILITALAVLWPPLVAGGFLYWKRLRIARKKLFFAIAAISAYIVPIPLTFLLFYALESLAGTIAAAGDISLTILVSVPLLLGVLAPLLVVPLVARFFLSRPPPPAPDQT